MKTSSAPRTWIGALALLIAAGSCDALPTMPDSDPDVSGPITEVAADRSRVRIEASSGIMVDFLLDPEPDIVVHLSDGERRRGDVSELIVGRYARAWVELMDDSNPATATALLIELEARIGGPLRP